MNTWLDHWDRRYTDRVRLLVEILPVLAQEPRFALKGGTAINLFEHDLPRLSVDIDLAWLPVHDYAEDAELIAEALGRVCKIRSGVQVDISAQNIVVSPNIDVLRSIGFPRRNKLRERHDVWETRIHLLFLWRLALFG